MQSSGSGSSCVPWGWRGGVGIQARVAVPLVGALCGRAAAGRRRKVFDWTPRGRWLWGGQEAGAGRCAGACGWRCRCLLGVVAGSKVTCERNRIEGGLE